VLLNSFAARLAFGLCLAMAGFSPRSAAGSACVWKVTGPNGGTLYLGGSIHALSSTDYPLPSAYNRAFDASSQLVFEDDPKRSSAGIKALFKAGTYPKGDSLKYHVDPRTYTYLRRFFALLNISEEKFSKFRPWLIDLMLESPSSEHFELGVETFLTKRAQANSKPVSGLESTAEHNAFFLALSDREAEALLLILFINAGHQNAGNIDLVQAWRRGDADALFRSVHDSFRDFPSLSERLLDVRNRNWIPKIESYLRSGKTSFVVVGAGHMGGSNGLLSLLRARGCKIEQL
jgi:uncharacterized protein YbaP (TraB family)